jgi:predicted  nucleic acid-binding Zn-ribbon protein
MTDSELRTADAPTDGQPGERHQARPESRTEARLRARIADLEAKLAELTHCLESAETRASEVLFLRALVDARTSELASMTERVRHLEAQLAAVTEASARSDAVLADLDRRFTAIATSRSWQMTRPLRLGMERVRALLGR